MTELTFWNDLIQQEPWPIARNPLVIAEIGINHNGSIEVAKELIDIAKSKGCGAVKFQKRTPELCVPEHQRDIPRDTPWGRMTYFEYKQRIEFGQAEFDEIDRYCRELGIAWFASTWDLESQAFMRRYETLYNKVASAMLTNTELLEAIASEGKMTFISVGMSNYGEIDTAVDLFRRANCPFILMHSVSEYPAANEILNLRQIIELRRRYGVPIGYSGHEMTMLPGVLAVMMGAVAIERHITINRAMWGTDHASSLEPKGLETLMNYIGQIPAILGTGEKIVTETEKQNALKMRFFRSRVECKK